MSEDPSTRLTPCPSCGWAVNVADTSGASEWITCPNCDYQWAAEPPRSKPKRPGPKPRRSSPAWRPSVSWHFAVALLLYVPGITILFVTVRFPDTGGVAVTRLGSAAVVFAAGWFCAGRWWRWAGFLLTLMWALHSGTHNALVFLFGYTVTICGWCVRERAAADGRP